VIDKIIWHGVVFVVQIKNGWYYHLKGFPEAVTKKGEPQLDHAIVLQYIKNNSPS
jgi:hypothetical protein